MSITTNSELLQAKVLEEQIKMLFDSTTTLFFINLIVAPALVYVFWTLVSQFYLVVWLGSLFLMLAVRMGFYLAYKKSANFENPQKIQLFLILGSAVAGVIWGAGGVLMFGSEQIGYQLFILLALMAMTGGSAFTLSVYLPAYFAYSPIALLPVIWLLFSLGGPNYFALGATSLVFLGTLTLFNVRMNRNFKESLALRFENLELIEQLQEKSVEAQRASMAKSRFLAAASHDLRQPLYALSLFSTALDELVSEPKQKRVVGQIIVCVDSLKSLFDSLLDISQLDAGVVAVEKSEFMLQDLFVKLLIEFQPLADEKDLVILAPKNVYGVLSEPSLLEQIIRNYLANAVRYTEHGSISLECEAIGDNVRISVVDTGLGIPDESIQDIFDEFYQLGNSERDRLKGLGLGLSIVKRTASLLEHEIAVESTLGKGSTFSINVPRAFANRSQRMPSTERAEDLIHSDKRLIVVIDDEVSVREGLKSLFEIWDCNVVVAEDGDMAIELLRAYSKPPSGIISDYRLRNGKTGVDAISYVQQEYTHTIPAIIVTGDIESQRLVELKNSVYSSFHKPVPTEDLRQFLAALV